MIRPLLLVLSLSALACASPTTFKGDAHVGGGPNKCASICKDWGMDLAGMIAVGEYSDGCICQVRGKSLSLVDVSSGMLAAVAGAKTDIDLRAAEEAKKAQQN